MDIMFSMYGRNEECIHSFGQKTQGKGTKYNLYSSPNIILIIYKGK
jgi:hypothetical protein